MQPPRYLIVVLAVLIGASACATSVNIQGESLVIQGHWVLTEATVGGVPADVESAGGTMQITSSETRIDIGCNRGGVGYEFDGQTLTLIQFPTTKPQCDDWTDDLDFNTENTYIVDSLSDKTITLIGTSAELVFFRTRAP